MPDFRAILILVLLLMAVPAVKAGGLEVPESLAEQPFELMSPHLVVTNDTLFASGGVTGRFENVTVRADQASGNFETGDLHLEGNIHFERDNVLWNGSVLDYNYLTQIGNFGPSSLDFDPVLMWVDRVERVATNEYYLSGATFTTCAEDHPHYKVKVREARLIDEKYLMAKGATFYIGEVPVFYIPYWRQTLSRSIFTFRAGSGSEWGVYGLVRATVPVTRNITSISDVNLYSKRGVGLGQEFAWDFPTAQGRAALFYLHDQDPTARYDLPDITADRYRFKLENLEYFSDTQYINTKWNYLSDPVVLKEFQRSEYRSYAQPENYASWVYGSRLFGTEAFGNYRLNDFYDNIDRIEYSLDLYRNRIGATPFYLESQNSIAHLEKVYAATNTMDRVDTVRIDSMNTLYLPQRYGFLSLVPRVEYRATYYSQSPGGSDEYRGIAGAGLEVSMQAVKVLSNQERWYGKGLRHRMEPYMDYIYRDSSMETNQLNQFDYVDTLGDEDRVKMGVLNILQTKRDDRVSRFIDLDLYTYYFVEQNDSADDFDSLFLNARMPLTPRTMLDIDGQLDWNDGGIPLLDTRFSYRKNRDLTVSLEHLYRGAQDESLWTPRFDLYPEGRFSLFGYARYEDKDNDLEEIALGGYVNWCCMRYGLGYHVYDGNEHSIMLSIGLSAFPEASISSGF